MDRLAILTFSRGASGSEVKTTCQRARLQGRDWDVAFDIFGFRRTEDDSNAWAWSSCRNLQSFGIGHQRVIA